MKRAGDWQLLDHDSDPLDADLYEVGRQADHYASTAELIVQQTARLRQIGAGDNQLVGKYAKTLEDKSADLAGQLEKTHKRYSAVGSQLKRYYPALDTALTESWGALQDALDADTAQRTAAALPKPTADPGKTLTGEQQRQVTKHDNAVSAANGEMAAAKKRLDRALSDLNGVAKDVAGKIHDSLHDGLSDSFWDKFKNFVVEFVKVVVEVAGYIAIACAVVALVVGMFIPGLDILEGLALAGLIATLVSTAGDTFLAATGNGSWFSVGLDIFALLTFGAGKFASAGLKAADKATAEAGGRVAARQTRAFNKEAKSLGRRIESGSGKARGRALAEQRALGQRPTRPAEFSRGMRQARAAGPSRDAWKYGGDRDMAGREAGVRYAQGKYPNSAAVARASAGVGKYSTIGKYSWSSGVAVAGGDKALSGSEVLPYDGSGPYKEFKDGFVHQVVPW
jgi:hypothetical protein